MLAKRIVACLDIRAGRVVKGRKFQDLRDEGDPVERAVRYAEQGADEIVVLDVSATLEERGASLETIDAISRCITVPLTVGGGVRTIEDFSRMLYAGADKIGLNTAAIETPELISEAAQRYGRQCVVLSIDAFRSGKRYHIMTRSATRSIPTDAVDWAIAGERLGAGEVLLTSIDRDGMQEGFDLDLIASVAQSVGVPVVASGGARDAQSFADALLAGADAALGASVFHEDILSVADVKRTCIERGVTIRP